jgi:N utilization substance protein A
MRGSRVQAVVGELQGEKIDIIQWNPDAATFIVNALAPAEVMKVVMDEDIQRIEVVVPDDQLSLAIGRRGQNVRLASQLTGWEIDILTESEESDRRQKEFLERSALFMKGLNVDEVVAQLLASEGFSTIEEVAYVELDEIVEIEGFDLDTAEELQNRAREFLEEEQTRADTERRELGVSDEIAELPLLTSAMLVALGKAGVKSLDDLADLSSDELTGWIETVNGTKQRRAGLLEEFELGEEEANEIIMAARAHWFEDEPDDTTAEAEEEVDS